MPPIKSLAKLAAKSITQSNIAQSQIDPTKNLLLADFDGTFYHNNKFHEVQKQVLTRIAFDHSMQSRFTREEVLPLLCEVEESKSPLIGKSSFIIFASFLLEKYPDCVNLEGLRALRDENFDKKELIERVFLKNPEKVFVGRDIMEEEKESIINEYGKYHYNLVTNKILDRIEEHPDMFHAMKNLLDEGTVDEISLYSHHNSFSLRKLLSEPCITDLIGRDNMENGKVSLFNITGKGKAQIPLKHFSSSDNVPEIDGKVRMVVGDDAKTDGQLADSLKVPFYWVNSRTVEGFKESCKKFPDFVHQHNKPDTTVSQFIEERMKNKESSLSKERAGL